MSKRGPPSTHTASRAPVGVRVCGRWRVPGCVRVCVPTGVCVRCCSRACTSRLEDCACLSPCVGDGYAPSVLSSLRSSSPSVATLCVRRALSLSLSLCSLLAIVVECSGGGLLSSRSCSHLLSSLSSVLACFTLGSSLSLILSLLVLSGLSPSVLWVVRGCSFVLSFFGYSLSQPLLDSRSSPPRSFLSLFIVTIYW